MYNVQCTMYKVQFPELRDMYICTMYNLQSTIYKVQSDEGRGKRDDVQSTMYNLSSVDRGLNHCLFEKVELINKFAN